MFRLRWLFQCQIDTTQCCNNYFAGVCTLEKVVPPTAMPFAPTVKLPLKLSSQPAEVLQCIQCTYTTTNNSDAWLLHKSIVKGPKLEVNVFFYAAWGFSLANMLCFWEIFQNALYCNVRLFKSITAYLFLAPIHTASLLQAQLWQLTWEGFCKNHNLHVNTQLSTYHSCKQKPKL